jgi:PAS domain S-box-containing protein
MAGKATPEPSRQSDWVEAEGSRATWHPLELVEWAHEAVLVRDADSATIQFWNRAAEALYGWTRQEALGQVSHVLLQTQFPAPLAEVEAELLASGYWEGDLVHTARDGRRLVVASRWVLQRDGAGQRSAYLEFNTDITQRKDTEARAELATLVEASDDAIIRLSLAGTITSWNPGAERLYGYTTPEAIGQPLTILAPAGSVRDLKALLARVQRGGQTERQETVRRRKDGTRVQVLLSLSPICDAAGEIVGLVANERDVTERRRAEEQLRQREEQFRATFEQAAVGMAHVGLDGRWLRVNHRLCEIVGYSPEQLLARTFQDITHPADLDGDLEQMQRLVAGEIETYTRDKRYVRPDGSPIWVALTVSLVRHADGSPDYFLGVVQDVDARRKAEDQSAAALRARDDVLGAVSHDLRTPLTAIAGSTQLLQQRLAQIGVGDERLLRTVERILGASRRMARMMEDLVDAARLEAGQPLALERAPTDLVGLVRTTVAEQEPTSRHHALQVSTSEPRLVGDWDAGRLRRALENLISNAIKYSPRGGEVHVEVSSEASVGSSWAVVRVVDQGLGIPSSDLPYVFERFRRAGNVGSIAGTGIGLAGTCQIVRQHGGSLDVHSQEGRGSTFIMRLPLRPAEAAAL